MAWREKGSVAWKQLVEPAIRLARDGFVVPAALEDVPCLLLGFDETRNASELLLAREPLSGRSHRSRE